MQNETVYAYLRRCQLRREARAFARRRMVEIAVLVSIAVAGIAALVLL
jgi:hypothetical protein